MTEQTKRTARRMFADDGDKARAMTQRRGERMRRGKWVRPGWWVSEGTAELVRQSKLPGESIDEAVNRLLRLGLGADADPDQYPD